MERDAIKCLHNNIITVLLDDLVTERFPVQDHGEFGPAVQLCWTEDFPPLGNFLFGAKVHTSSAFFAVL